MFWMYLVALSGAGVLVGAVLLLRSAPAIDRDGLGMTRLQKRAWLGIVIGVLAGAGLAMVLTLGGLERYDREPAMRLLVYAALAVGVLCQGLVLPRRLTGEPRAWVDERDLRICERAPAIQGAAVLVALAAWSIALTEGFKDEGAIPIVFPSLIFLSVFFVYMVSSSLAILIGYRYGVDAEGDR